MFRCNGCGGDLRVEGGCSAHASNWYCSDPKCKTKMEAKKLLKEIEEQLATTKIEFGWHELNKTSAISERYRNLIHVLEKCRVKVAAQVAES